MLTHALTQRRWIPEQRLFVRIFKIESSYQRRFGNLVMPMGLAVGASDAQRGGESGATVLQPIIRRTPSERSAQTDGKSAKMGAKSRSHMPDICVARACVT